MKHTFRVVRLALIGLSLFAGACAPAPTPDTGPGSAVAARAMLQGPVHQAAGALYEGIQTHTLDNGLRVYLKPVPGAPVVTTMVAYRVGSADEDLGQTGLSHYLEHLMFKGTERLMPGDIDRLTLRNGGANNAYTDTDFTVFHFDFAADRWDAALAIEADRMRNLRIDERHEFEHEKGAVIEELRRDEDEPWDLESKALCPLLFGAGPYGHPIIGQTQHVRAATAAIIKTHYDRWYHPNNAVLVIAGGFDPAAALAKVHALFDPIPAGKLPERKAAPPARRTQPARAQLDSKFAAPRMIMGFNTIKIGDPDDLVLDVASQVLAGGKTSRLYQRLVQDEKLANMVNCSNMAGRYPGWFGIMVEVLPDKDRAQAEAIVLEELHRLAETPLEPAELERAQRSIIAGQIFAHESVHDLADSIARAVVTADLDYVRQYLPRIAAVTPQQVQAAARRYFDPQTRAVVWSVPSAKVGQGREERETSNIEHRTSNVEVKGAPQLASAPRSTLNVGSSMFDVGSASSGLAVTGRSRSRQVAARSSRNETGPGATAFSLRDAQRVVLPNGLTLLLLENHRLPIVVAAADVRRAALYEPAAQAGVAELMGRTLSTGTTKHTGNQIAQMIEDVGGTIGLNTSGGVVQTLSADRKLGLSMLLECLTQPAFPKNEFARERDRMLSDLEDAQHQPEYRAHQEFLAWVYGAHPLGRPSLGTRKTVEALTPQDCAAFHQRIFVPNNTVLALVGDFDAAEVVRELTDLTSAWRAQPLADPVLPAVVMPDSAGRKLLSMPDAAQLHFYMGHPGIRRDNPDYYRLLVMDYVLGTGPGFTDRLTARIRDREGLAYTVNANITATAGTEPGTFTCYVGTEAQNLDKVERMFREEIERLRREAPTDEEVADAKAYLTGSLPFRLTTTNHVADLLLKIERHHLGFAYLDDYRRNIDAVTPLQVQQAAQRYLDPQRLRLVAAGAIDAQGKALPATEKPAEK